MNDYKMCIKCLSHYEKDKETCPFCGSKNTNNNPAGALALGTVIGDAYTIGEFRELDGEGVIYTGVDNANHRRVMIKEFMPVTLCTGRAERGELLPKEGSEVLFKTSMMDFSEVYTTLIHMGEEAALAQVYDLVSANGTAYAVTEYLEGEKLDVYLQRYGGAMDWRDTMVMLEPVCIAVEKLHRLGWIHRGISPDNIIIDSEGNAKLTGYATMSLRTAHSEFKPQQYPGYTAPEQYSVREYQGAYTDIYALGAVLYRTITGETPPPAKERQVSDTLVPASELVKVPKFISVALLRAMKPEAAGRFQTVLELREALADVNSAAPVKIGGQSVMKKIVKENRVGIYIAAGIIGMVVLIAIIWFAIRGLIPTPKEDESSSLAESGITSSAVSSDSKKEETSSVMTDYINLPSFIGMDYKKVQEQYGEQIRFELKEEYHDTYKEGEVFDQSPLPGSTYQEGSVVTLMISKGQQKTAVPSLFGLTKDSAIETLKAAGISRYMITVVDNDGTSEENIVLRSDPDTGTEINVKDQTVTLYVTGPKPKPEPPKPQPQPEEPPKQPETETPPEEKPQPEQKPAEEEENASDGE